MGKVSKYERYLEVCETERQEQVINSLIKTNNIEGSAKVLKITPRGVYDIVARLWNTDRHDEINHVLQTVWREITEHF